MLLGLPAFSVFAWIPMSCRFARAPQLLRPATARKCLETAASARCTLGSALEVMPERQWRARAEAHRARVQELLAPGFLRTARASEAQGADGFWPLDPHNPIYNFLLRYYNIRGASGTRRLAKWSPGLGPQGAPVLLEGADMERDDVLYARGLSEAPASAGAKGLIYSPADIVAMGNVSSFLWYREVLRVTRTNAPVLNCFGLHEWAMQYQPDGAPDPPSRQYQDQLPLRVSQEVINAAVERRGVRCTHVDALRFFAPAAKPLNQHGDLSRKQQIALEQPACVHASMDLLKIALKLAPLGAAETLADALQVAIAARRLDVAAAPYDASAFGLAPIPVETPAGRVQYRDAQIELMEASAPVRDALLAQYSLLLDTYASESSGMSVSVPVPGANWCDEHPCV